MYLAGAKNTDSWRTRKGDLLRAFPLDVSIASSSVITVAADVERLSCDGFSLSETVHLGNFEFITVTFSGLSLSSRRGDSGTTFMGSTRSGVPSLWQAMTKDSAEEFLTASSRGRGFYLPFTEGVARGLRSSHHNHTTDGERSGGSGHDSNSPVDGGFTARKQPPFRVMSLSPWVAASASPCSVAHH
jgi:hypothetical protein